MKRYVLLLAVGLMAVAGYSAQAATTAHKTVICHATKPGATRAYIHVSTTRAATIRTHQRHAADIVNPVGGICPKQRLTWFHGGRSLAAGLAPEASNTEGAGSFAAQSNIGQGRICWRLTVTGLEGVTAAHIHYRIGPKATAVAVPLVLPTPFHAPALGCSNAPRALLRLIVKYPARFYVNVHTATYPTGAVSGPIRFGRP